MDYRPIKSSKILIPPHHFILGTTLESLILPDYLCARVDGKSKIGRKGLSIQNAGHIGPGFRGEITLELYNANEIPIELEAFEKICQIEFHELSSSSTRPYSGQYLNQKGPQV
jgi:dCTP deaminase